MGQTMRRTLALREWERQRVPLSPAMAENLAAAAGGALRVEATGHPGQVDVVAGALVGTIVTRDVDVVIRPKAGFANVLYLLGVAVDDIRWWQATFTYDQQQELVPAVLAFFARATRQALEAGLMRRYRHEADDLPTVRGRIDIAEIIRRQGRPHPVPCAFEDFTADNRLNRYLRAAVRAGLRWGGASVAVRQLLMGELMRFDGVADVVIPSDALDTHTFTRLDQHYETPLRLAKIVLQRGTLSQEAGATSANAFLIDMNALFEDFVANGLARRLRGRLDTVREPRRPLDEARHVTLKPDLEFRRAGRPVYVGDVKYKLNESGLGRNPDYYQLLAYTTALELDEGLLIYCLADGGRPPREVVVRGSGKRLHTYLIDVTGDLADLERALDRLANHIATRTNELHAVA